MTIACAALCFVPGSLTNKLQFCNFCSVFSFSIYYALGNLLCVIANQKVMIRQKDTKWIHIMGVIALVVSVCIYFRCLNDKAMIPFVPTIIIIIANLYIALVLQDCIILAKWGRYTMYCCGNEYIIRHAFDKVIHLNDWTSNRIVLEMLCWIWSIVFILFVIYFLCPLERVLIEKFGQGTKIVDQKGS